MVRTRSESKIFKNQEKFNSVIKKNYILGKQFHVSPLFMSFSDIKLSTNRVNIPICKKSYKNPSKLDVMYIPFTDVGLYYLYDKYNVLNFSFVKYNSKTKNIRFRRNFHKICRENDIVYSIVCINYGSSHHANMLVINKKEKTIHLFEPAMIEFLKHEKELIIEKISEYFPGYKKSYSAGSALQRSSSFVRYPVERGYCLSWCIWFIEVCIMNDHCSTESIDKKIREVFKYKNTLQYIRGYSYFYRKIIIKLGVKKLPYINTRPFIANILETRQKIYKKCPDFTFL